jgi:NAD-dependent dihydropyrimidine dehydrogenase PreA subunit
MKHRYLKNVATLKLNQNKCKCCGRCTEVCPHKVFALRADKAEIIDLDSCIECGACVKNCPFKALEVKPGVGCATAIIKGWLTGSESSSDCSSGGNSSGCC